MTKSESVQMASARVLSQYVRELEAKIERQELAFVEEYHEGLKEGLRRFAWWESGQQFVGTCGTTLSDALAKVAAELQDDRMRPGGRR